MTMLQAEASVSLLSDHCVSASSTQLRMYVRCVNPTSLHNVGTVPSDYLVTLLPILHHLRLTKEVTQIMAKPFSQRQTFEGCLVPGSKINHSNFQS